MKSLQDVLYTGPILCHAQWFSILWEGGHWQHGILFVLFFG